MTLEVLAYKDGLSAEEISEFQKNLSGHIKLIIIANDQDAKNSIQDKPLNERIKELVMNSEQTLHISTKGQAYFLKATGDIDLADATDIS
jgi:hypothetical protein